MPEQTKETIESLASRYNAAYKALQLEYKDADRRIAAGEPVKANYIAITLKLLETKNAAWDALHEARLAAPPSEGGY